MEKNVIKLNVDKIPISNLGEIQDDHEIWEQTDGGAHFKVTKHTLPRPNELEIVSLSVSGDPAERSRVIDEFRELLGQPASTDLSMHPDYVEIAIWVVE